MSAALPIIEAAATGVSAIQQYIAGQKQKTAAAVTAAGIEQIGELNASLIESGSELNAKVHDFNAAALDMQATDAIAVGAQQETIFRQQLRGVIASQRASYAAQGVEVSSGSAEEVQESSAYQGELDALQIRVNAARSAWGYNIQAEGERQQAAYTRKLGKLQATNTRDVARVNASNARITGQNAASASNWGAAATIAGGAVQIVKDSH